MEAVKKYSPEFYWEAAVNDLDGYMSRAAFNNWLKPSCLVTFENDTFVIGCRVAGGRDWLEGHLTRSLQNFLSSVMNRAVKVHFVFLEKDNEDALVVKKNGLTEEDGKDTPFNPDPPYWSIRESLLEPKRVVRLPVYYLRWLPYVGAQTIFLVMGLWQEYYLASNGRSDDVKNQVSVRAERICQWAGISRAQFFRIIQTDNHTGWFTNKTATKHVADSHTGRIKKSANQYELYDIPLTPGDEQSLRSYLVDHGIQQSPLLVLKGALRADLKEILRSPERFPTESFESMPPGPGYLTVQKIVRELIGQPLDAELSAVTSQLVDRILARGEFILVSWYFLKNWLPILGPQVGMFILLMRSLCYFNAATGEIRDEAWIDDGYVGIAERLGIKNSRLVANWFPARFAHGRLKLEHTRRTCQEFSRRKRTQEMLGLFVERSGQHINTQGSFAWKFKVQIDDPLIPLHEIIQQAASELLEKSKAQGILDELDAWITTIYMVRIPIEKIHRVVPPAGPGSSIDQPIPNPQMNEVETSRFQLAQISMDCSPTLKGLLNDCFKSAMLRCETLELDCKDCYETLLKILKNYKDSKKEEISFSTFDPLRSLDRISKKVVEVGMDQKYVWSLERLLSRVDKRNKMVLLDQEMNSLPFISWIIQGTSQNNILNPLSLAIAKLRETPGIGSGGASERLATLPPGELCQLIKESFMLCPTSNLDWQILFPNSKRDRIRLLADILDLDINI